MRLLAATSAALAAAAAAAPAADAASRVIVRGAGFGHGVGLSQYGAYGFAKRGTDYRTIVGHYYTGTSISRLGAGQTVRVLLQATGTVRVSGVTGVAGGKALDPATTYVARGFGAQVVLRTAAGTTVGRFGVPLVLRGASTGLRLGGQAINGVRDGRYRGNLELRPTGVGLNAINAVALEDYVRGVVSAESPASWPADALRAQAVVARTYAITTKKPGVGFDHYPDVRSQVYTGIRAEYPSTDAAVRATAGEVVTYRGTPVVTYFFSTSGGRTENVENSFLGAKPAPWLKSVPDPYDTESPKHRWGPFRWTIAQAQQKFGGWVKGRFRGVTVVRRGVSPRIVAADIVGTGGRTRVTGPQLRARLGLDDTWVSFRVIGTGTTPPAPEDEAPATAPSAPGEGGAAPRAVRRFAAHATAPRAVLQGRITPGRAGAWVRVERRGGDGRWTSEVDTPLAAGGTYRLTVQRSGLYRVRFGPDVGPAVRVR